MYFFLLSKQKHRTSSFECQKYYFSKVCMPITQEVLEISQFSFRVWFLTNFSFVIFVFKVLYGSVLEILGSQCGSIDKIAQISVVKNQIWVILHSLILFLLRFWVNIYIYIFLIILFYFFFLQFACPVTQENGFLTNICCGIFIVKALCLSFPEILGSQCDSMCKL